MFQHLVAPSTAVNMIVFRAFGLLYGCVTLRGDFEVRKGPCHVTKLCRPVGSGFRIEPAQYIRLRWASPLASCLLFFEGAR